LLEIIQSSGALKNVKPLDVKPRVSSSTASASQSRPSQNSQTTRCAPSHASRRIASYRSSSAVAISASSVGVVPRPRSSSSPK